ncbi:MAG: hypothetical protein JRH05_02960 [Deltaproteobacteria bacterium]|nr:hypothetical protein [Deltaproteobacteria bacterium]
MKNPIVPRTLPRPALGTFFLCLGLLAYELLCARLMAVVVGPHMVYGVIAMAMLGAAAACTLVTVWGRSGFSRYTWLFCLLLTVACLTVIWATCAYFRVSNSAVWEGSGGESILSLLGAIRRNVFYTSFVVGALLSIPYVLFGIVLASLFKDLDSRDYHRVYGADLLGAAGGCAALVGVLELWGYRGALCLVLAAPIAACFGFGGMGRSGRIVSVFLACLVLAVGLYPPLERRFEPVPHIRALSRDYKGVKTARELWHAWNNYTRVGLLEIREKGRTFYTYALEAGQGWARLDGYHGSGSRREPWKMKGTRHPADAVALFRPERTLVLLAGVGADMLRLHRACDGSCEITGVEMNRAMIRDALARDRFRLKAFFSLPGMKLVTAEGREYLERSRETYDAILVSFTGASVTYYVGTSGHTTQYLYTKEAFDSYLEHLAPGGVLAVVNTNKAKQLLILRRIFRERRWGRPDRCVVILKTTPKGDPMEAFSAWYSAADNNLLLFKREGFSDDEVRRIRDHARRTKQTVLLAPGYVHPGYRIYREILCGDRPQRVVERASKRFFVGLDIPTDDRPFILDMSPRNLLLRKHFWVDSGRGSHLLIWRFKKDFVVFVADSLGLALVVILLPLCWKNRMRLSPDVAQFLAFFFLIGTGFMFVEVGLVQKLGLLLGNPGFAIAVVLATLILGTGAGSLLSDSSFSRRFFSFKSLCVAIPVLFLLLVVGIDQGIEKLLGKAWPVKALSVSTMLLFMGFFLGHLFPRGLKEAEEAAPRLVPWAFAVNGAASTVAAGLGVLLSRWAGFDAIILCGALCYALILVIPRFRRN